MRVPQLIQPPQVHGFARKKCLQRRGRTGEPPLYRELRERFSAVAVPPEDGVVTHLNRQGFNPNAVRPAAKAFLETMSYLEEIGASDSHGVPPADEGDSGDEQEIAVTPQEQQHSKPPAPPPPKAGMLEEKFNLNEGPVILTMPAVLSEASYADLADQFELFLRRAKRRVSKPDDEAAN